MPDRIERELALEASPTAVWHALTDHDWLAEWLADEVLLDLRPGGEAWFRFGDSVKSGWVEEVSPPGAHGDGRLSFWWSESEECATRVELVVSGDEESGRSHVRVTETRPLEILDLVGLRLPGLGGGSYGPALVAA
ncbi:MAG: SRPBCC domain-containing protein [Solirubrobacterales bacterium]|nr:SRPBCC domain-containing protein [Solirubrobacterales bacterium]MBV9714115.1 SRPBCC domain-containing protein [Solirubrobacterales bacterium]